MSSEVIMEVRCIDCGKLLFKITDQRYIEIPCSRPRCRNKGQREVMIYDIQVGKIIEKRKDLTKNNFTGKIIIS